MIYFGKKKIEGINLRFRLQYVKKEVVLSKSSSKSIPHLFIGFSFLDYTYYMGINRFKRIKKDEIYELDGVKYFKKEEVRKKCDCSGQDWNGKEWVGDHFVGCPLYNFNF